MIIDVLKSMYLSTQFDPIAILAQQEAVARAEATQDRREKKERDGRWFQKAWSFGEKCWFYGGAR